MLFVCSFVIAALSSLMGAALVAAFRSHGEASAVVAEEGLRAITIVAALDPANTKRLGEAGVCEGLLMRLADLLWRLCLWSS